MAPSTIPQVNHNRNPEKFPLKSGDDQEIDFFKKKFFPQKKSVWTFEKQFLDTQKIFSGKRKNSFQAMSDNDKKSLIFFPLLCYYGHVECSFDNPSDTF